MKRSDDVADRAGQREDQRRHREDREERRLGGQAGDPVAHARSHRRDDDPPQVLTHRHTPRPKGAQRRMLLPHRDHGAYGIHHAGPSPGRHQPGPAARRSQRRHLRPRAQRGGASGTPPPTSSTTWCRWVRRPGRPRPASTGCSPTATTPSWSPYDRYGNRIDEVDFHPSWHWLMERAVGHGLAAAPWDVGRAARARTPRGRLPRLVADRARPRLPDLDDVRRRPGAAGRRRDRQGVDAAAGVDALRPRACGPAPPSSARWPAWA